MRLKRDWWILLLLALASVHCVQCIFFDNYSYMDLAKYEQGSENMPFQGRVAMMPLLHWAHSSSTMNSLAHYLLQGNGLKHIAVEPYTPEKCASFLVALVCLFVIVGVCSRFGQKYRPDLWWLCPALVLAIFYSSYAARAMQNMWYPYDLPHAALFTLMCVALLEKRWAIFAAAFLVDVPMRETSIYILPCLLAVSYSRRQLKPALAFSAAMLCFWAAVRWDISLHYRHNSSEIGIYWHQIVHALDEPRNWGQVASVFGFLALPLALNRKRLTKTQNAFLLGAIPGILFSAIFAIWYETRVWSEWNGIVACLAFAAFIRYLEQEPKPGVSIASS